MPELNPQMAEILALVAEGMKGRPERTSLSPVEARAQSNATFEPFWNADRPTLWAVYNHQLPVGHGPLRVRLYDPGVAQPAPCLVYVHGGGWVIGSLDSHDGVCRRLARAGEFMVASIDYRLAPEHKFPAGLEDCLAAVRWLAAEGGSWGIDPARLAIGGDSAGANLALATLLSLRAGGASPLRAGLLIYGAYLPYTAETETASQAAFGDGSYVLSSADMRWFWQHYVAGPADNHDPLAVPLLAEVGRSAAADGHRRGVRSLARRQHPAGRQARGGRRPAPLRPVAGGDPRLHPHDPDAGRGPGPHRGHGGLGAGAARRLSAESDPARAPRGTRSGYG